MDLFSTCIYFNRTGAVDDETTELQKMLTTVNEMSLTKPEKSQSALHRKKVEKSGDSIRNAALNNVSDSESDDYILNNYSRNDPNGTSRKGSNRSDDEMEYVTKAFTVCSEMLGWPLKRRSNRIIETWNQMIIK